MQLDKAHDYNMYYSDVIIRAMASQITGGSIIYSTVCSVADQKHQSSQLLAFVPQSASNAEKVSIRGRHHVIYYIASDCIRAKMHRNRSRMSPMCGQTRNPKWSRVILTPILSIYPKRWRIVLHDYE